MKKRFMSLLLALVMVLGLFSAMTLGASAADPTDGKKFLKGSLYAMRNNVEMKGSATIEAEVWVSPTASGNVGCILGNYGDYGVNEGQKYYRLDITNGGFVQIHTKYAGVYVFDGVKTPEKEAAETLAENKSSDDADIRNYVGSETDGWKFVKIAVVLDVDDIFNDKNEIIHRGKLTLYINGEKISEIITDTLNFKPLAFDTTAPLCVGGDWRVGEGSSASAINSRYFQGRIKNVTLYSDLRTEAEIKASGTAETYTVDPEDKNLVAAFDCTRTDFWTNLKGSGNDLVLYTRDGTTFEENGIPFQMSKFFSNAQPRTVAAEIFVPHYLTGWGGVICSNKANDDDIGVFSLEITENGVPALTYTAKGTDGTPENKTVVFDKANILINDWVKLAVVHEGTALKCYVNGSLKQTVQVTDFYQSDMSEAMYPLCIGGSWQRGVDTAFKGVLRDIAFYSDAKTSDQVKAIKNNGVSTSDSGLLAYYDLKATNGANSVEDSSGNKFNLGKLWFPNRVYDPDDYAFTFVVVGDTQKLVFEDFNNANDDIPENDTNHTATLYQWIVDNAEKEKIEFVFGVGDIIEYNYNISGDRGNKIGEWEIAKEAITKLSDAGIPYSLVCGNHDKVYRLDDYFAGEENFTNADILYYEGTSLGNYCMRFEAGGIEYMVVCLDFGANDLVLKWAAEQIESNPERRVIVTTHSYLYRDGTTLDADDEVPPNPDGEVGDTALNNGIDMWNELFSQHRNVSIVFCGHDGVEDIIWRQDRGEENNLVTQFLVDPQTFDVQQNYQTGMVALFHFTADGRKVAVEWYSTERDMYYKPENQFEVKIIDNFGNGIYATEYIKSDGLVDTYRIYYTNGTYADFTVTNGNDGKTPYVGANGNWFIGDVDTGISASGTGSSNGCGAGGANAHTWDKGEITTAPTFDKEGVMTYTCTACGTIKTALIDKLPDPTVPQFEILSPAALVGETFEVVISLKNNPGFSGLNLHLDYPDIFTLVSAENCIPEFNFSYDKTMLWDNSSDYSGDGELVKLVFKVADGATEGRYRIDVKFIEASNESGDAIGLASVSTAVEVLDILYGDANGDGLVNSKDVVLLRQHIVAKDPLTGVSTLAVEKGADCNGDGEVNSKDVVLLRQYIVAKDPITGESSVVLGPEKN